MAIHVNNLTKMYGQQHALDAVSFSVEENEIVGFLGPNGAGKSTTFKIATTYLPPTSGTITVAGFDVVQQPMEVKKIIGYLPEHNPLYLDMFVHEYLHFAGSLYGMKGKVLRMKVGDMVERCGLTREQNKKIESLSKGYRQRVGLAQALLHDPKVLILDEPTSGLDPSQIVEIRKLIKEVSQQKTVIFSTHIMQEVEAICDRVVVINKGKIVADDRLQHLMHAGGGAVFVVEFEAAVEEGVLLQLEGVEKVSRIAHDAPTQVYSYRIVAKAGADVRGTLFRFAADKNLALIGLKQEQQHLEGIFLDLINQQNAQ